MGPAARPLLADLAVAHAEHRLRELDRHREARSPDPEERARAAGDDGRRDAGDVPGADRGGECGHERLEGRERALPSAARGRRDASASPKCRTCTRRKPRAQVETDGEQQPDRPRAVDGVGRARRRGARDGPGARARGRPGAAGSAKASREKSRGAAAAIISDSGRSRRGRLSADRGDEMRRRDWMRAAGAAASDVALDTAAQDSAAAAHWRPLPDARDGGRPPAPAPHVDDDDVLERVPRHAARCATRATASTGVGRGRAHRAVPRGRGRRAEGARGGARRDPGRRPVAARDDARRGLPPARGPVRGARPRSTSRSTTGSASGSASRSTGCWASTPRTRRSPRSRSASTRRRSRGRRSARRPSSPSSR